MIPNDQRSQRRREAQRAGPRICFAESLSEVVLNLALAVVAFSTAPALQLDDDLSVIAVSHMFRVAFQVVRLPPEPRFRLSSEYGRLHACTPARLSGEGCVDSRLSVVG